MKTSIQKRLLGTTTCVLALFLAITGFVLDRSFQSSVVTGAEEQMRLVIYSLMGAVEEIDGRLSLPEGVTEPRLQQPDSGLYARVSSDIGEVVWTSPSAVTTAVDFPLVDTVPGDFDFLETSGPLPRFHLSYTVIWEDADPERVVFSTASDQQPYRATINEFRRSLWIGLGAATLIFVLAQLLALRWGLLPLRTMAEEVHELEAGERESLSDSYPRELEGLAENLDRFVAHEQRSRTRYRNALEDLAHSLKTPLAVVRNSLLDETPDKSLLSEQLDRMQTTVTHQLTKASASGPVVVGKSVLLGELVARLLRALDTAYVDRGIEVATDFTEGVAARGDERDFMEMLGNLLENAFKYTSSRVDVRISNAPHRDDPERRVALVVIEDDGPGIAEELRTEVLGRGKRADEIQSGQGIGLAVVAELVGLYHGWLEIGVSELGGARLELALP